MLTMYDLLLSRILIMLSLSFISITPTTLGMEQPDGDEKSTEFSLSKDVYSEETSNEDVEIVEMQVAKDSYVPRLLSAAIENECTNPDLAQHQYEQLSDIGYFDPSGDNTLTIVSEPSKNIASVRLKIINPKTDQQAPKARTPIKLKIIASKSHKILEKESIDDSSKEDENWRGSSDVSSDETSNGDAEDFEVGSKHKTSRKRQHEDEVPDITSKRVKGDNQLTAKDPTLLNLRDLILQKKFNKEELAKNVGINPHNINIYVHHLYRFNLLETKDTLYLKHEHSSIGRIGETKKKIILFLENSNFCEETKSIRCLVKRFNESEYKTLRPIKRCAFEEHVKDLNNQGRLSFKALAFYESCKARCNKKLF